jgi:hypothetical protein
MDQFFSRTCNILKRKPSVIVCNAIRKLPFRYLGNFTVDSNNYFTRLLEFDNYLFVNLIVVNLLYFRPSFSRMKVKKTITIDPAKLEEKKNKQKRDPNDLLIHPGIFLSFFFLLFLFSFFWRTNTTLGNPLPSEGTCKHYKHSFRYDFYLFIIS